MSITKTIIEDSKAVETSDLVESQDTVTADDEQVGQKQRLPFSFAKTHGVLIEDILPHLIKVKHKRGASPSALAEVRRWLARPLECEGLSDEEFQKALASHYEQGASSETMQMMEDLHGDIDLERIAQELPATEDLLEKEDDAPIIRLINAIFTEAIRENASDIHIETYEERLVVRFRVDGALREVLHPKRVLASLIVSRIKVMAQLDIAEKRIPQDGRISLRIAGRAVDVRVSTMPSSHGERVVLRLLDKQAGRLDLEHLGMESTTLKLMDDIIHKPHGIILVTGPTGSGKTTTLYAVLERLNSRNRNILTVEDPIEYHIEGIGQSQVNTKVDMTFARGLRAILRQDPDVVMVGEIRDLETAEIAVQASLTGHMVLSTLHTNTAVGAVTRLHDMGIEPFLLSSSLIGVLAQRLVRVLCPDCKTPYQAAASELEAFGVEVDEELPTLYKTSGCDRCNHTGYYGRTGIYELIIIDEKMRNMIHDQDSEHALENVARHRTQSIRQDGWRNIIAGVTTVEEVLRVTRED